MQIVDIAHTLETATLVGIDRLKTECDWSDRNHRIFERLFKLKSAGLYPGRGLVDVLEESAARLLKKQPQLYGHVDMLIYCHAGNNTFPAPDLSLQKIARSVFDINCECLSVTFASCASALFAIKLLSNLALKPDCNIVILTGEKCFFETYQFAENNGVFGEVSSAILLQASAGFGVRVKSIACGRAPQVYRPLVLSDKATASRYDREILSLISQSVQSALKDAGIPPEQISVIFPTHLNPFTSLRIAAQFGISQTSVFQDNHSVLGHCYCGDLFINIETWMRSRIGEHRSPVYALSFAAGMTGSHAAIVLEIENK